MPKPVSPGKGLPEDVPLLCGEDVCADLQEKIGVHRHSIHGWFEATFPLPWYHKIRNVVAEAIVKEVMAAFGYHGLFAPFASLSDQAVCWNRAMRALGYDVSAGLCVLTPRVSQKKEK